MAKKESINPEQWVAAYADYLYAFALKRLKDPELCKDLVQDTFVSAIKNLKNYKGSGSEKTWLTAILKNKITDVFRRKTSETPLSGHLSGEDSTQAFFEENGHWKDKHSPRAWGMEEPSPFENKELKRNTGKLPGKAAPPLGSGGQHEVPG